MWESTWQYTTASCVPPLYGKGGVWLLYTTCQKMLLPYLLPNSQMGCVTSERCSQKVTFSGASHSVLVSPICAVWHLTSVESLSVKLQNLTRSDKQFSCISRGRSTINQVKALQFTTSPTCSGPGSRASKMGWSNTDRAGELETCLWDPLGVRQAATWYTTLCCFPRAHVFTEWAWVLGIRH